MDPASSRHRTLDVRGLAPQDAERQLFAVFDRLAVGETALLVSDDTPSALLEALQQQRQGLFEWSLIDPDPRLSQVLVARRPAPAGALRHVTETMAFEHHRLAAMLGSAFAALDAGDLSSARATWTAFHRGLNRHIHFEEELLFPAFECRTGLRGTGPTAQLRAEHREIRMLLDAIARGLAGPDGELAELRASLLALLTSHSQNEEAMLYPATDRLLADAESNALVGSIQAFVD